MKHFTLLSHQWKSSMRSAAFSKNMGIKILMGFFFFIIFLELLGGGFFIGKSLSDNSEQPIASLSGYGIYFFLVILIARYMLQKLPTLMVRPYLTLPLKKSQLVNFVLTKPLFNSLNILPLSFVLAILLGLHQHIVSASFWAIVGTVIIGDLFVNYLALYVKRVQIKHEYVFYLFLGIVAALIFSDRFNLIDLQAVSSVVFMTLIQQPLWLGIGLVLFAVAYYLNFQLLFRHFSLDDFSKGESNQKSSLEHFSYLNRFGKIGAFALLELKMCIRNKRTRTMLFISPLFLLYGLFFYTNPTYLEMTSFLIFVGIFITGGFMMNFGLYFFAWESGHFDLILTANNTYKDYIKAKYFLMVSTSAIIFLFSVFYIYFGINILIINTACFLFNIGVNSLLLLYFSTNNTQYMDLSKGSAFNYQGVGGRHFVVMIPLLVLPILIYLPFGLMGQANVGFSVIGALGILGLLFHEKLLDMITKRFIGKRYRMAEGFRDK